MRIIFCFVVVATLTATGTTHARDNKVKADSIKILDQKINILARELEELRLSGLKAIIAEPESRESFGLGPSAGNVYNKSKGISIAGYGEMLYENFNSENENRTASDKTDRIDFLRQIIYFGYAFNRQFLFNSEIEYEHASTGENGEVSVEFAYIDYSVNGGVNFRMGLLLMPMGIINEYHEPPTWYGTTRPLVEAYIIPTTWRANGLGFLGKQGGFEYKLYLTEGLDAAGFNAEKMLRGGRQKGSKALAEKFAYSLQLNYTGFAGFKIGTNYYYGDSGQNTVMTDGTKLEIPTHIFSIYGLYDVGALNLRALYAYTKLENVELLNDHLDSDVNSAVAELGFGYYFTAAFNILSFFSAGEESLSPYLHYEYIDTQSQLPAGYIKNQAFIRNTMAIGLGYMSSPQIILKADYRINKNEAQTGINQLNIILGYMF